MNNTHNPYPLDTHVRLTLIGGDRVHGYISSIDSINVYFVRYDSIADSEGPTSDMIINKHSIGNIEYLS